ncbi:hypothetical protein [Microbispora sp. NBRC 16548]|uniref:hypothetical protein n=1 Tax=Microbispora sp. NBRC 16548 TaxID=3030994 RepID=UPI00255784B8|nr:hypothetical protein [Microbispora sp. NBRC 16548]
MSALTAAPLTALTPTLTPTATAAVTATAAGPSSTVQATPEAAPVTLRTGPAGRPAMACSPAHLGYDVFAVNPGA